MTTPGDEKPRGERTEVAVRKYDADGNLTSETITVTTVATPPKTDTETGMYL